jgi:hypothetical protein
MNKKYIIEIADNQPYPFDGVKENCSTTVRLELPFTNSEHHQRIYDKIHCLLAVTSTTLLQLTRILEVRGKSFVIDYEYIAEGLAPVQKVPDTSVLAVIKEKLELFYDGVAELGIKKEIRIEEIGVNTDG